MPALPEGEQAGQPQGVAPTRHIPSPRGLAVRPERSEVEGPTLTPTPLPEGEGLVSYPRPLGEGLVSYPRPLGEGLVSYPRPLGEGGPKGRVRARTGIYVKTYEDK